MVLSDPAISGLESAWCMDGYDSQNKDKIITITKKKESVIFFLAVYHSKKHLIPHHVIGAILDVILDILQR